MKTKSLFALILCIATLLTMVACSGGSVSSNRALSDSVPSDSAYSGHAPSNSESLMSDTHVDEDDRVSSDYDAELQGIARLGGWWYRQSGAEEAVASLDIFKIDPETETAYFVTQYGEPLMEGPIYDNNDESITVSLDFFGDNVFYYDDEQRTLSMDDGSVFVYGPEINMEDFRAEFEGKWFLNGDLQSNWYEFNNDGTYTRNYVFSDGEVIEEESGHYHISDVVNLNDHGSESHGRQIECDGSSIADKLTLSESGNALFFSGFGRDDFFIRESVIGTNEGDYEKALLNIISAGIWYKSQSDDDLVYALQFYSNFTVVLHTAPPGGYYTDAMVGEWSYADDGTFEIQWEGGERDVMIVNGDVLTSQDGVEFERH